MTGTCCTLLFVLAAACISDDLTAQVEAVPFVGFYAPTSDFRVNSLPLYAPFGASTGKQETSLLVGGLARVWVGRRVGVQLGIAHTSSDLRVSPPFASAPDTSYPASLTLIVASALVRLPVSGLPNPVWVELGGARITRGGAAFRGYSGTRSFAGLLGLGTGIPLAKRLHVEIGLNGLVYRLALADSLSTFPSALQIDLVARVGLSVGLGSAIR